MLFGRRNSLARDYEVSKRPSFLLSGWDIVQRTDSAAYALGSVTDSVMYGTNGCVGVRHHCENETIGFEMTAFLNGVYHNVPFDACIDSMAFPKEMQVGATICDVNFDCLIDGDPCTLRAMPRRRLGLRSGTYYSECHGVVSGDGGVVFDSAYRRVVSMKELDLWGAEIIYSNFDFGFLQTENHCIISHEPFHATKGDSHSCSSNSLHNYAFEFFVTLTVDPNEWNIVRGDSTDDILLQSRSSGLVVGTVTHSTCVVKYSNGSSKNLSEQNFCNANGGKVSRMYQSLFTSAGSTSCASDTDSDVGFGCRVMPSLHLQQSKRIAFKKQFSLNITKDNLPVSVTLSFLARHNTSTAPLTYTFPKISEIIDDQRVLLDKFWESFDIDLQQQDELTPNRLRLSLLYNAFRLFSVSHNLAAGLPHGGCSATEGNLLYDLEQYIYHGIFYTLTSPPSALALLRGLYLLLPQARRNAHRVSLKNGAVFPRSTINGTECRYYSAVNHAKLHVNAEIGYIIRLYFTAVEHIDCDDRMWLLELIIETARVWPQLGEWVESEGVFRLDNIAGPDEYNSSCAGNFYIHLSAKMHLRYALELYNQQQDVIGEEGVKRVLENIGMNMEELKTFQVTSDSIVIHRNDHLGVYMVHDYFHTLEEWKAERSKHPLSMNYHPLAILRHRIIDIPEVLLGMLLYQNEFEKRDFLRCLAYYEPLCTYDSPESLAIVAAVDFKANRSFSHSMPLLRSLISLDLDNLIYTADEGLNFGAMSSSWLAIVCGIGGFKLDNRKLCLDPCFPAGLSVVKFTLCWRGATLLTAVDKDHITYELIAGNSIRFIHGNGYRISLHKCLRRSTIKTQVSVPRLMSQGEGEFDGAIFFCETLFDNITEITYMAWYKTLELLFENYRILHLRDIPPLTAEEFVSKVIYQAERREIAFSGIHNVLLQRGIDLDLGTPDDAEIVETRYGLANAKIAEMSEIMSRETPQVNEKLYLLLKDLASSGVALAVVTYTRSLKALMSYNPDVMPLFLAFIDGEEAHDRHIKSRPHIDIFLRAAEKIHVDPARCVVFSMHLDRDYRAEDLARFRMFFDVEEPFLAGRAAPRAQPYPTLDAEAAAAMGRSSEALILPMSRSAIPTTINALEDFIAESYEV